MKLSPLFLLLVLLTCGTAAAQSDCSANQCAQPTWQVITVENGPVCAHGTPFSFFYHQGGPDLLVYFEGGGACWSQATCQEGSSWYKAYAVPDPDYYFWYFKGVFDFAQEENPFRDYTMVFIPNCSGDAYIGSVDSDYGDGVVIHHQGFANMQAVLSFLKTAVPQPDSVFVTGCSAGSFGSAVSTPYFIQQYPDARLTHLGDSLGGLFYDATDLEGFWNAQASLPDWIPDLPSASAFRTADYYIAMAQYYPDIHFAQYNSQYDQIQSLYSIIPFTFAPHVNDVMQRISAAAPNFSYFVAGGNEHCVLQFDRLYQYRVGDQRMVDWLRDLAQGVPVNSFHCEDCGAPEVSDS